MLNPLFPRQADNSFHGFKPALWIFGALAVVRVIMSLNSIFNGRTIITTADGIPLDTFTPPGAQTVISLFALLALANLIIALVCIVVLIRYRALVPFLFLLLLLQHLARTAIVKFIPIVRSGAPPAGMINLTLVSLTFLGFALSLWQRGRAES